MLAIGRALLNDNRLLLIDEPTKGLAPHLVTEVARALERAAELTTILLVEQNLGVVHAAARDAVVLDQGRVVHAGPAKQLLEDTARVRRFLGVSGGGQVSTFVLLTITGLGLGAMYFLIASGLSLIYGLMGVLNFAHGAFLTVGSYATWYSESKLGIGSPLARFLVAALIGLVVGAVVAALVELVLIRPLYQRHIEQVLVTVGLGLAITALVQAIWGNDARVLPVPGGRSGRPRSSAPGFRTTAGSRSARPWSSSPGSRRSCA